MQNFGSVFWYIVPHLGVQLLNPLKFLFQRDRGSNIGPCLGHVTLHRKGETKSEKFSFPLGQAKAEIFEKLPIFEPTFRLN